MEENIKEKSYVIDTSFVIAYLLPEDNREHTISIFKQAAKFEVLLIAPSLLSYEVANALLAATSRKRIAKELAAKILMIYRKIKINRVDIDVNKILDIALKYKLSCYDASYLALAKQEKAPLLTFDGKLKRL